MTRRSRTALRTGSMGFFVYAAIYLAGTMGLFAVLLVPQSTTGPDGSNTAFIAVWAIMYLITLFEWIRLGFRLNASSAALLALGGVALLSAAWSVDPLASTQYASALIANIVFAIVAYYRLGLRRFLRLSLGIIALLSLLGLALWLAGVDFVQYVDPHERLTVFGTEPLRGLFNHKITAGAYGAVGMLLAGILARGAARAFLCSFFVVFILLSGSFVGVALAFLGALAAILLRFGIRLRLRSGALVLIAVALIVPAAIVTAGPGIRTLELVGRDATLTGRTQLWEWGTRAAIDRPLLGWGYSAYPGSRHAIDYARDVPRFQNYDLPHFHNSFLQVWVDLGPVVALSVAAWTAITIVYAYRRALTTRRDEPFAVAVVVSTVLCAAMVMHVILEYNQYFTVLLVLAFITVRWRRT